MSNVVGLNGRATPLDNGSEPEVIAVLERVLEMAKNGELNSVGIVVVRKNWEIGSFARYPGGGRHLIVAGCEYLKNDLINAESEDA